MTTWKKGPTLAIGGVVAVAFVNETAIAVGSHAGLGVIDVSPALFKRDSWMLLAITRGTKQIRLRCGVRHPVASRCCQQPACGAETCRANRGMAGPQSS
ncbi:hypothetical protein ACFQU3_19665 [Terrabacter sp. GCM10028922]